MAGNPMQQFSVHKIGPEIKIAGIDLSFTNASLFSATVADLLLPRAKAAYKSDFRSCSG